MSPAKSEPVAYGRFSLESKEVPRVETKHRRIVTPQPAPQAVEVFRRLLAVEPRSMACQPPVLWHRAEGHSVEDGLGNRWIDWSSCVLVANAGHAPPEVIERLRATIDRPLLSTYVFGHADRAELCEKLIACTPLSSAEKRVFLLTTGSEAVECAIKLARTWGRQQSPVKRVVVSFVGGFHGRTLGSQRAGGIPALKTWIGDEDTSFVQVPFPDGYLLEDTSFDVFERTLAEHGVDGAQVAGVLSESYLGIGPDFFPDDYAQKLRSWCDTHGALLAFDEVQAGFGRTGKLYTYEHYNVRPDLVVCGKGISSSLPLAAVIGRSDVLSIYPPGSMTSTHSGSPLSVAAGLGALEALDRGRFVQNAARLDAVMSARLAKIEREFAKHVGCVRSKGLVGGVRVVKPGTKEPDADLAHRVIENAYRKGLLLFAPVGLGGGCLKIAPPLSTPMNVLEEGFDVFVESIREALAT